jgi:hypothetical protein
VLDLISKEEYLSQEHGNRNVVWLRKTWLRTPRVP